MEHSKGLHVGVFTETYKPQTNGVVTAISNLTETLTRKGCQLSIFTAGEESGIRKEGSVVLYRFKSIPLPLYPEYRVARPRFSRTEKLVKKCELDILHSHGPFSMGLNALYAHRKLRLPLVGTFHTILPEYLHYLVGKGLEKCAGRFLKIYSWKFLRWYYSRCDVVTCPSLSITRLLNDKGFENVVFISNGVDAEKFSYKTDGAPFRKAYGLDRDSKIILYLGRIGLEKNIEPIIKAMPLILRRNKHVKLVIAGSGPAKDELLSLVNRMGLTGNIVFTGFVPDSLLPNAYAACNLFVTLSHTDNQPLTILEALATGKPLIASRSSISEFVRSGWNGFIADNAEDFADKALQILQNDRLERKMGRESRRMAESYSLEKTGSQMIHLYKSLL